MNIRFDKQDLVAIFILTITIGFLVSALVSTFIKDTYKIVLITIPVTLTLAILLNTAQKKLLVGVTFLKIRQLINHTIFTVTVCIGIAFLSVKLDQLIGFLLDKILNLTS